MSVVEYVVADRVARITLNRPEREGFRAAVRARDDPFGDAGASTYKG
jgi:hypothetical protein